MFGLGDIDTSSRRVFPQRGVLSPPPPFQRLLGRWHIIYGPFGHGFKGCKREAELYWHMAVVGMYVQLLLFLKRALLASNFIVEGLNHIMGSTLFFNDNECHRYQGRPAVLFPKPKMIDYLCETPRQCESQTRCLSYA